MEDQANAPGPKEITLRLRLSRRFVVAAILSLLIIAGAILWLVIGGSRTGGNIFSQDTIKKTGFPLYYPDKLPKGLVASQASVRSSEGVVTYSIDDRKGNSLAVSEQAIPANFDFAKFYKDNVELPQQTKIPTGTLTTGKFNGLPVCMLVITKTWIIINDPSGSHQALLDGLCRGLRTY